MASFWLVSPPLDASPTAVAGTDHRRVSGWVALAVGGWIVSQVVSALVFVLTAPTLLVEGTASGVRAAELLDGVTLAISAGAPLLGLAVWQIPAWATQVAAVAVATSGLGRSWRDDLRLRVRLVDVPIGVLGGVGAQLLIGVAYSVAQVDVDGPARQLTSKGSGTVGLLGLLLLLAVAAPVVEELLFRGLLQGGLSGFLPKGWALVISAAVFAAIHFQTVQFPGLLLAGLVFGGLAQHFDRLGPAIFAHIAFNASTVLLLSLT